MIHLNRGTLLTSSTLRESSSCSCSSTSSSPQSYIDPTRRSWSSKYLCNSPFSSSSCSPQHPSSHSRRRSPPSSGSPASFRHSLRLRQSSAAQRNGSAAQRRIRMRGEQRRRKRYRIRRFRSQEEAAAATVVTINGGEWWGSWWRRLWLYCWRDGIGNETTSLLLGKSGGCGGGCVPTHGWGDLCMRRRGRGRWKHVMSTETVCLCHFLAFYGNSNLLWSWV